MNQEDIDSAMLSYSLNKQVDKAKENKKANMLKEACEDCGVQYLQI